MANIPWGLNIYVFGDNYYKLSSVSPTWTFNQWLVFMALWKPGKPTGDSSIVQILGPPSRRHIWMLSCICLEHRLIVEAPKYRTSVWDVSTAYLRKSRTLLVSCGPNRGTWTFKSQVDHDELVEKCFDLPVKKCLDFLSQKPASVQPQMLHREWTRLHISRSFLWWADASLIRISFS